MAKDHLLTLNKDGSVTIPDWMVAHLEVAPDQSLCVFREDNRLTIVREDERDYRGHPYASWRQISHRLLASD